MKPETREWVEKAEGDFRTARRELLAPDSPNYDAVCFHAQQCAEKYLKARLVEAGVSFPRIHDLTALLRLARVEVRYPGMTADAEDANAAVNSAMEIRSSVRRALGLE